MIDNTIPDYQILNRHNIHFLGKFQLCTEDLLRDIFKQ